MTKTMLVPESWSKATTDMPKAWADMYAYCNAIMEPWDGPAALAMTDGRWVCGGLDRNGLRPLRYVVTTDSDHDGPIFPDLAKDAVPDGPDQLWVPT